MFTHPSAPAPTPDGPQLRPPPGPGPALAHLAQWLTHRPWLAAAAAGLIVVWSAGAAVLLRWRHRLLTRYAQQVTVITPPEVDPDGAAQFWATVYGTVQRTAWRRWLYGTPHLAYEYRWAGRALSIVIWVPGTVAVRSVAAAARAAWPASTVNVDPATAPLPLDAITAEAGGALLPARGEAYPLRTDHDPDPLRQIVAAGTGLRPHENAVIQILARPASPRRVARLRRTPRSCGTRARTAVSTRRPRYGGCSTSPPPHPPPAAADRPDRPRAPIRPGNATSAPSSTRSPTARTGRPRSATGWPPAANAARTATT